MRTMWLVCACCAFVAACDAFDFPYPACGPDSPQLCAASVDARAHDVDAAPLDAQPQTIDASALDPSGAWTFAVGYPCAQSIALTLYRDATGLAQAGSVYMAPVEGAARAIDPQDVTVTYHDDGAEIRFEMQWSPSGAWNAWVIGLTVTDAATGTASMSTTGGCTATRNFVSASR